MPNIILTAMRQNGTDCAGVRKGGSWKARPKVIAEVQKHGPVNERAVNPPFHPYEDNIIRRFYRIVSSKELALMMNRPFRSVRARAKKLGVTRVSS